MWASIGFVILGVVGLFRPNFGFMPLTDVGSFAYNIMSTFVYTECIMAIRNAVLAVRAKKVQSEIVTQSTLGQPKKTQQQWILIGVVAVVILMLGSRYAALHMSSESREVEISKEYSIVAKKMVDYYSERDSKNFPHSQELLYSNILSPESFASESAIQSSVALINAALLEFDGEAAIIQKTQDEVASLIKESDLSEEEAGRLTHTLYEIVLGEQTANLRKTRNHALKIYYEKIRTVYQFMLAIFDDYGISTNSDGLFTPLFYTDTNRIEYDKLVADMLDAAAEYQEANQEIQNHLIEQFKTIDVKLVFPNAAQEAQ